ncbi:NADPH-dependent 1-acyldihydroxyacetone phosphate reductase [Lachnellula arida]|uniref:NADPH-dependent 1-acyldihydroxyacetone phosphate reductase n=1 Tax=Lachnellula arida TaxID=1316785 RepID=A0A8T9BH29_9HELO|nr:NADPH-dependent 1-acyldihydroxyacetone phosphate reductase [Lachnellula arida]
MANKMSPSKRTVLITGCSDGGLGAALALAFHEAGLHVYATARNPSKMSQLAALGIETLTLDILSESSIAACRSKLSSLDILVNNAGNQLTIPVSDISIPEAKSLFDINVWGHIAMTQAFLPLLVKSKGMIVNQTSVGSVAAIPFASVYAASKAAMAMFSNTMRLELQVFDITVIELKTGLVQSNLIQNQKESKEISLPEDSIYAPAKEQLEKAMRQDEFVGVGMISQQWGKLVVQDLLKNNPPPVIWRGDHAMLARIGTILPFGMLDGTIKKIAGLDKIEEKVKN